MKVAITRHTSDLTTGWFTQPVTTKVVDRAGLDALTERLRETGPAWLIATSPVVFEILEREHITIPEHVLIACLGPGTARTAPRTDFVGPQPASARTFVEAFDPGGLPMIFAASTLAGPAIEELGAERINIYRTDPDEAGVAALQGYGPEILIVTASSAAKAIATMWEGEYPRCVAIGRPTAETLREAGIEAEIADEPTRAGLVAALERMT